MAMSSSSKSGPKCVGHSHRAFAVGRSSDQVDTLDLRKQELEPLGGERLVIRDQDFEGMVSHRRDPAAGSAGPDSRRPRSGRIRNWRASRTVP